MGKLEYHQDLHQQQQQQIDDATSNSSSLLCQTYSVGLTKLANEFNFKCVFVLILSLSVFLTAFFWILPLHHSTKSGFDSIDQIKLSATVQAYFRLEKPVSLLIPRIERLEYDISGEVGVPHTNVAILSMHESRLSSYTDVLFGVLSDQMNSPIDPVSLSVLRSSLVELFLQQSNLTLTTTIFGQPSLFEILKCPGGITVIPTQSGSIWQIPQVLFNFTLFNSVYDIQENFAEFKEQLKFGLHLRSYENVYVQITNKNGSTIDPPVTVQASILSDFGGLLPQRLKQLAQAITRSPPAKNLGLDNTVFGRVKSISLSSYLNRTLHTISPTPAPSPSTNLKPSSSPYHAPPSYSIAPSPNSKQHPPPSYPIAASPNSKQHPPPSYPISASPNSKQQPPCTNCYASLPGPISAPVHSYPPINALAPSIVTAHPPRHCLPYGSSSSLYSYGFRPCSSYRSSSPPIFSATPDYSPGAPSVSPTRSTPHISPQIPSSRISPSVSPLSMVSYGSRPGHDQGGKSSVSPSLAPSPFAPSQASFAVTPPYQKMWIFLLSTHLILTIS